MAIVLSGGGARGNFQVGALRALYDGGVHPDIVCGTSVGALNAAKIAEGEGSRKQGLTGLEQIWFGIRHRSDIAAREDWWYQISRSSYDFVDQAFTWRKAQVIDETINPITFIPNAIADMAAGVIRNVGLLIDAQTILERAESFFNLQPLRRQANNWLDPSLVASSGIKLRLHAVAMGPGALHRITETGQVVEAITQHDGSRTEEPVRSIPSADSMPAACQQLSFQAEGIKSTIRMYQRELSTAAPGAKARIVEKIRKLQKLLAPTEAALRGCIQQNPTDLIVDIRDGIVASAAAPVVFHTVQLESEDYTDGGVREIIPITSAIDLGAQVIYAISASGPLYRWPAGAFRGAGVARVAGRAAVLGLDEIDQNDRQLDGTTAFKLIEPDLDIHELWDFDPGLIRIRYDYGYMRALDVLNGVDPLSQQWKRATEIYLLRYFIWLGENSWAMAPNPRVREGILVPARLQPLERNIAKMKKELAKLVNARQGFVGPGVEMWSDMFELHHWQTRPTPWSESQLQCAKKRVLIDEVEQFLHLEERREQVIGATFPPFAAAARGALASLLAEAAAMGCDPP